MRLLSHRFDRAWLSSLLLTPLLAAAGGQAPAPSTPPQAEVEISQHPPEQFAGTWDYNADESINAATGKPEQAPRSATTRAGRGGTTAGGGRGGGGGGRPGGGAAGAGGPGGGPGGGGGGGGFGGEFGSADMMRSSRDLARDLLEVPETLTIAVTPTAVTFTDDLDRSRTYPTDGSKHRYRIAASQFDARVVWRDSQLRKDIEGDVGFKMSEVYFLNKDASRLFVILRVAGTRKDAPPVGADRVYERVDPAEARARARSAPASN